MKKRLVHLLTVLLLVCGVTAVSAGHAGAFGDVGSADWFGGAVQEAVSAGLMKGVSPTAFSPYAPMTRAQFVTILGRMNGDTAVSGGASFCDVPAGAYYAPYVRWAADKGVVTGNAGRFLPNQAVSRQQASSFLARYLTFRAVTLPEAADAVSAFTDAEQIADYAKPGMETLRRCGLLRGNGGQAQPEKTLTRAEGAQLLVRLRQSLLAAGVTLHTETAENAALPALHVSGAHLADSSGNPVQLRGVSTHGLAWYPQYVNEACFRQLHQEMGVNVVRLAMYTAEYGGYCTGGDQARLEALIDKGVQCAADNGMYAILDWHILSDGNPNTHLTQAERFFGKMAAKYARRTNVLYEICNEPNGGTTWAQIKSYAGKIIPIIRAADPDSVILVGTPNWSQRVDLAAASPIAGYDNLMYTLHFYAATHTDALRNTMTAAVKAGLPVFVSEYGICDASGSGSINTTQANLWISAMNRLGISYVAWNLSNKAETSALLKSSCSKTGGFTAADLSDSGKWLVKTLTGSTALTGGTASADPEPAEAAADPAASTAASAVCAVTAALQNSWSSGGRTYCQYQLTVTNCTASACRSWTAQLPFQSELRLEQGWNGAFSVSGKTLTISSADYNGALAAGAGCTVGCIVSGTAAPAPAA